MRFRKCRLVLASASPRRRALLAEMGYAFDVVPAEIDEEVDPALPPARQAEVLAERKAEAVASRVGDALVLGADTIVACGGRAIGKASGEAEAREFLRLLTSHRHAVITGLCVLDARTGERQVAHDVTWIRMRAMTDAELDAYIASAGWQDKAGAYALQEGGDEFVEAMDGSESNVVGLPAELVAAMVPYAFREYLDKLRRDLIAQERGLVIVQEDGDTPETLLARYDDPDAPLELEIGPGKDDFVVGAAQERPEANFLAIERLRERVGKLCGKIRRAGVTNVRVFFGDVRFVVARLLRAGQLRAVYVHHPDPYLKRRHARRRLFQPDFTALLADRMAPGAILNVSTDVRPYAEQIAACLSQTPGLENRAAPEPWLAELPGYHQSVYERKRRNAGAAIHYILFRKADGPGDA